MALSWDYEDVPRLVARLSPPASPQEAERALRKVYRGFTAELYRERHESQPTKDVGRELIALQKALAGLSPRATNVLCGALDDRLFLPFPYEQAQAVINPCRDDVPVTRLAPAVILHALKKALDEAIATLPKLSKGSPGTISRATKRAVEILCRLYCKVHEERHLPPDDPDALAFAWACLRAWAAPIGALEPSDVIRSLKQQFWQK